jgi:tetratricopeptide (TPR) repeat protein
MGEALKSSHPDSYTFLLLAAGELDELGVRRVRRHVESCSRCRRSLDEIEWLDRGLKEHREEVFAGGADGASLPAGDPFSTRPEVAVRRPSRHGFRDPELTLRWAAAARDAVPLRDRILSSPPDLLEPLLDGLPLEGLVERYGLGFALDEVPLQISRGPVGFRPLADLSLRRLQRERLMPIADLAAADVTEAEFAYPLVELAARAHLLDGIICNWTGEYDRGARSFLLAWTSFADGLGSDLSLATVEVHESQRRSFAGDGAGGLALANRACRTFEEMGSVGDTGRALYAVGIAVGALDREEEALEPFRRAAEAFAKAGLWRPYVGAVSSVGSSLMLLGRMPEARREFARALKLTSQGDRPAETAGLMHNLGLSHFRSGDYPAAARSFQAAANLFERLELPSDAIVNGLHLAESLARVGKTRVARECLERLEDRVKGSPDLDPAILREFSRQFSDGYIDFELLGSLRERLEASIRFGGTRPG